VPLLSGEIVVNREGADLGPGDVIRLCSTRLGLANVVMRISEIGQGDGRDNGAIAEHDFGEASSHFMLCKFNIAAVLTNYKFVTLSSFGHAVGHLQLSYSGPQ
jgi:hypothetical protein